jgi:hypothetical protein
MKLATMKLATMKVATMKVATMKLATVKPATMKLATGKPATMKLVTGKLSRVLPILWICALTPGWSHAGQLNFASLSCAKYESQIMNAAPATPGEDAVNVVMWLFGWSVGKSGAHVMYGDALQQFGNALDGACKSNPSSSVLDALGSVKPNSSNPMDLGTLSCVTFEARHLDMSRTDPESATTIMMWLYGFSVGRKGGNTLDSLEVGPFGTALAARCNQHTAESLLDALAGVALPKHP